MKKILCLILILMLMGCKKNLKQENDEPDNNFPIYNKDIKIETEEENIFVTDVKFYYFNNNTTVEFNITNNTDNTVKLNYFDIICKNKDDKEVLNISIEDDKEIGSFLSYNEEIITAKSTISMMISLDKNYSETSSLDFAFNNIEVIDNE